MQTAATKPADMRYPLEAIEELLGAGRASEALLAADNVLSGRLTPGGLALEDEVRVLLLRARARRVLGRSKGAQVDVRRAVAMCGEPGNHPQQRLVLDAWRAVADQLRERGHYRGAERVLRVLVERGQSWFGHVDPSVGKCLNELGAVLDYLGANHEAHRCFADALLIFGVEGHEDSAASVMVNLAHLHYSRGRLVEAEDLARRAEAQIRQSASPHWIILAASNGLHLAAILGAAGHLDEAAHYGHDALEVFREAYGGDHIEVANCLHVLALITMDAGDPGQARAMLAEALRIKLVRLGPRHPDLLPTMLRLAQMGDAEERSALLAEAEVVARRLPPTHALRKFVASLHGTRRFSDASW